MAIIPVLLLALRLVSRADDMLWVVVSKDKKGFILAPSPTEAKHQRSYDCPTRSPMR
jgi:hypothetical protein